MTTKCQKNIATVVKIKSYNSKSGLIFTIRPKFKELWSIFAFRVGKSKIQSQIMVSTAEIDCSASGLGLIEKLRPLLLLKLLILPILSMLFSHFCDI